LLRICFFTPRACSTTGPGGGGFAIECIDKDGGCDLALLKLEKRIPHRQATVGKELAAVAARAYVIGAPKDYSFSIGDGLISQIRSVHGFRQYQLSCPIFPGNSGSPVFNPRGEVIGIASRTKADAQNVSFAIPTQDFIRLNVLQRPATWEQLAAAARPAPPASLLESRQRNDQALEAKPEGGSFGAFLERLNDCVGKSVTVVVQEAGQTRKTTSPACLCRTADRPRPAAPRHLAKRSQIPRRWQPRLRLLQNQRLKQVPAHTEEATLPPA